MKRRIADRILEPLVLASGFFVIVLVLAMFYFLANESRFAFRQKFPWGYRLALIDPSTPADVMLDQDPYSSLLASHPDGADGIDDKEEGIYAPTLEELAGTATFGTGSPLDAPDGNLYRDDWRAARGADDPAEFTLHAWATPEYAKPTLALAWEPDASFEPRYSPFRLLLRLKSAPAGSTVRPFEIDLKERPRGRIELPTFVAATDADRLKGYQFEVVSIPQTSNFVATIRNLFRTQWNPTIGYAQYGVVALLVGTLSITIFAVLIATPVSIALAIYLSEIAPPRLREWLKPTVELLASIPTVVLGYFGLMLVAPALQQSIGAALGMSSGRTFLAAAIVMSVLLIPTIATFAEDALRNVPNSLREGAEALGLTLRESLKLVLVPAAKAGIIAAVLLGFARAMGETMIVWILSGGTPNLPSFASVQDSLQNLLKPMRGIPDTIAIETQNVTFEEPHYGHLFLLGVLLFALTLAVNLAGYRLARRASWR
jgi:phosphate transport system permease protein